LKKFHAEKRTKRRKNCEGKGDLSTGEKNKSGITPYGNAKVHDEDLSKGKEDNFRRKKMNGRKKLFPDKEHAGQRLL